MEPVMICSPAITGIGLVSVLGQTADQTWQALLAGRSIADHARVPGFSGPNRAIAMAHQAAAEALTHARWTNADCQKSDSALFVGTSKGAIESWMQFVAPDVYPGLCYGLSEIDVELARSLHFGAGPRLTISSACSSGLHALLRAAMAIERGEARRALVVAVEASVHPLFISSFKRLGVLAPQGHGCRPFDSQRKGFVISEAAAAVCLESSDHPVGRPIVRIDAWAIGGDGTHLTAGDPAAKALRHLLHRVARPDLDLIHAHATGTIVNDPAELSAIESIAAPPGAILYSHKGALGHSLGAAGLISAVLNCMSHTHALVPPNVRSTHPLPTANLRFSTSPTPHPITRSLALAAGFGGPLAVVSFVNA
ncbi:MAG: beta-ketoacyl synthase N-terminal-like domain-containing protein [Tepidisphaeraceae bacterium]|jgi:3-oxoacyl-[acyl-carrier-protein] synthase II